jgi:hypothetical protein
VLTIIPPLEKILYGGAQADFLSHSPEWLPRFGGDGSVFTHMTAFRFRFRSSQWSGSRLHPGEQRL